MRSLLVVATLLCASVLVSGSVRDQSVAIKGKLLCGTAPAKNVRVKLFDEDSGPDPDDLLDQGYTNSNGEFNLKGGTDELTNIDPVFKIYHDCDDGIKPGSRKIKFKIPYSYVTNGRDAKKTFDIGTLNLETIFSDEERELIVSKRRRHAVREFDFFDGF